MQLQEIIKALEVIDNELIDKSGKFCCHYPIERRHQKIIAEFECDSDASSEDIQRYKQLNNDISAKLKVLENLLLHLTLACGAKSTRLSRGYYLSA